MSDSEMRQDEAILKLLKGYAAHIEQSDFVDGIDQCKDGDLEESVLSTKKCHIDAKGHVCSGDCTETKKSEK